MERNTLYELLDIEDPSEFEYYENLAALLEADEYIEEELIEDLLNEVDKDGLADMFTSYFDEFTAVIPDEQTDLYVTIDEAKRSIMGLFGQDMDEDDVHDLAGAIVVFRKWYVLDQHALDLDTNKELNIRDARYNMSAARYTGDECNYDFSTAYDYGADSYTVRFKDMLIQEAMDEAVEDQLEPEEEGYELY